MGRLKPEGIDSNISVTEITTIQELTFYVLWSDIYFVRYGQGVTKNVVSAKCKVLMG